MTMNTDDETLNHARETVLKDRFSTNGTICPCCDQVAKVYRRRLNSGMAASLLWLVNEFLKKDHWVSFSDAPRSILKSREIGKLQHWGLVVKGNDSLWKPTRNGILFATRKMKVPSHALIYNNDLHGLVGDDITIDDALGEGFNYGAVMDAIPTDERIESLVPQHCTQCDGTGTVRLADNTLQVCSDCLGEGRVTHRAA